MFSCLTLAFSLATSSVFDGAGAFAGVVTGLTVGILEVAGLAAGGAFTFAAVSSVARASSASLDAWRLGTVVTEKGREKDVRETSAHIWTHMKVKGERWQNAPKEEEKEDSLCVFGGLERRLEPLDLGLFCSLTPTHGSVRLLQRVDLVLQLGNLGNLKVRRRRKQRL